MRRWSTVQQVGAADGLDEGSEDGPDEGCEDGPDEGGSLGPDDGCEDGRSLGPGEGSEDGRLLGPDEGSEDGRSLGSDEGSMDGAAEGADEGLKSTSPVAETIAWVTMSVTAVTPANCPPLEFRSVTKVAVATYGPRRSSAKSAVSFEYSPTVSEVFSAGGWERLASPTDVMHTAAVAHVSSSDVPQILPVFCAINSLRAVEAAVSNVDAETEPARLKSSLAYLGYVAQTLASSPPPPQSSPSQNVIVTTTTVAMHMHNTANPTAASFQLLDVMPSTG